MLVPHFLLHQLSRYDFESRESNERDLFASAARDSPLALLTATSLNFQDAELLIALPSRCLVRARVTRDNTHVERAQRRTERCEQMKST